VNDPRRRGHGEGGFTLVETIVAFAILSLVIATALQIVGSGNVRTRAAAEKVTAIAHAQATLASIEASRIVSAGRTRGQFEDGYLWELTSSPRLHVDDEALTLWDVTVAVALPREPALQVKLRTVLLAAENKQ
jgi:general secretion pathway protein I